MGYWMGFYGMVTEWVSDARLLGRSLDGFRRHGHWVGFRGMAAGWVTGWVSPFARVLEDFRGGVQSWSTPYTDDRKLQ